MKIGWKRLMAFLVAAMITQWVPFTAMAADDDFPIQFTLIGIDIKPGSKEEKVLREMAQVAGGRYLPVKAGDSESLLNAILEGVGVRPPSEKDSGLKDTGAWEPIVSGKKDFGLKGKERLEFGGSKEGALGSRKTREWESINSGREGSGRDSIGSDQGF